MVHMLQSSLSQEVLFLLLMKSAGGKSWATMNMAQHPDCLFQALREKKSPVGPRELGITAE